jgi:hypothetical protein
MENRSPVKAFPLLSLTFMLDFENLKPVFNNL